MAFRNKLKSLLETTIKTSLKKENAPPKVINIQNNVNLKVQTHQINQCMDLKIVEESPRNHTPLAIILSWLNAKEKHLDHYRRLYYSHGFDVLTVRVSPMQLMLPTKGSQVVAEKVLEFLKTHPEYKKYVMHTFSVGAYLFGEMMLKMKTNSNYFPIVQNFAGIVMDSSVDVVGLPQGFSRSISSNPMIIKALESYANTHLAVFHNISTKHYYKASKALRESMFQCPSLWFASKKDFVASPEIAKEAASNWVEKGNDVTFKIWDESSHVGHFQRYSTEYKEQVNTFLSKIGCEEILYTEKKRMKALAS